MDLTADRIAGALQHHPSPALPVSSVLELVAGGTRPGLDRDRLLEVVRSNPDLFRLLEPSDRWQRESRLTVREQSPRGLRPLPEPWVVLRERRSTPWKQTGPRSARAVLDASVRHLALGVDTDSLLGLARWARIAAEASRITLDRPCGTDRSTTPPPGPPR